MSVTQILGMIVYGMGVGIVLAAPVGPINVEIIRRGLLINPRAGWLVGCGALTADTLFAILIVSGVTRIADKPELRAPLFIAGALMLGWLGYRGLASALAGDVDLPASSRRDSRSFVTGFLMAALNPMGIVYWLSVGSALVAEAVARSGQLGAPALVGGVFLGILAWITSLSLVLHFGRRFVTARALRWITGVSSVILIGFAIWFAIQAVRSIAAL
ncbi:MAG TPA: LysE family transporter [Thermomicrobiales bacterium]|nr:LysE family transporter [Thermomicrobiales bacterium]